MECWNADFHSTCSGCERSTAAHAHVRANRSTDSGPATFRVLTKADKYSAVVCSSESTLVGGNMYGDMCIIDGH